MDSEEDSYDFSSYVNEEGEGKEKESDVLDTIRIWAWKGLSDRWEIYFTDLQTYFFVSIIPNISCETLELSLDFLTEDNRWL